VFWIRGHPERVANGAQSRRATKKYGPTDQKNQSSAFAISSTGLPKFSPLNRLPKVTNRPHASMALSAIGYVDGAGGVAGGECMSTAGIWIVKAEAPSRPVRPGGPT
jgi:hypothetical protein